MSFETVTGFRYKIHVKSMDLNDLVVYRSALYLEITFRININS